MRYLNYLLVSLSSALIATYAALWLSTPSPLEATTLPPLTVDQDSNQLLVWGGWKTVKGYEQPGVNAVEIRCSRQRNRCIEAHANILHHDAGQDLEAHVFEYQIESWTADRVKAVATAAMDHCLNRTLSIEVAENAATLSWAPGQSCKGDSGQAVLVGDPI